MILAIESSTPHASLALLDESSGEMVLERTFSSDRAHNSVIFEPLREMLATLGDRPLSGIVQGTGPGSYSGVRVGIAVASALGLARACPVVGLPSIAVLARDALVVGDARRQSFYTAEVRGHRLKGEPELWSAEAFSARIASTEWPVLTSDTAAPAGSGARVVIPRAVDLARLAAGLTAQEWSALASIPLEPLYLRAPYITTPNPVPRGAPARTPPVS
ncbi:MAG: tRNA (adenosine(37)-N6)-threonylcarbamoyltransferase complex dimerization subunit type 1 TsaB [Verrucomicrobia bacterium]|nr:tRNA (adenosine(37)-N6)-threonylcarbamoyltransferase complex dimerization subunit type 1 TsaB [Verrucomicrobiota bacterium]